MSVLEKIVQAEKEAQEILAKAREEASSLLLAVNDDLATLKANNAASLAKQISDIVRKADNEISAISATFDVKKDEISSKIALSATYNKNKIIEDIFKDIVA